MNFTQSNRSEFANLTRAKTSLIEILADSSYFNLTGKIDYGTGVYLQTLGYICILSFISVALYISWLVKPRGNNRQLR